MLAAIALSASAVQAQPVGILGGVPGDAETSNRILKLADRVTLESGGSLVLSLPLNGARNYNFYYDASETNGFLGDGPYVIEYADKNDVSLTASSCQDGRDDKVYGPTAASGLPYTANSTYTSNADVFYDTAIACRGSIGTFTPRQDLANSVPGYVGALGIQGRVGERVLTSPRPRFNPTPFADVDLMRRNTGTGADVLVASVQTNGNGFFSFYYLPGNGNKYEFLPGVGINTVYRIVASTAPLTIGGRENIAYNPDELRLEHKFSPINNRDYYVVGARRGDSGAGQGDIVLQIVGRLAEAEMRARQEYADMLADARTELKDRIKRGEYAPVELGASYMEIAAKHDVHLSAEDNAAPALSLEVFPNPASDRLFVRLVGADTDGPADVAVFDILGREVLAERLSNGREQTALDLGALSPGVYVVEVRSESAVMTERITVTN